MPDRWGIIPDGMAPGWGTLTAFERAPLTGVGNG